jgi:hypothetical protein
MVGTGIVYTINLTLYLTYNIVFRYVQKISVVEYRHIEAYVNGRRLYFDD